MGREERRTCSTLTTEVTFPALGSGLSSHPPESSSPLLSASFPSGALCVLEAIMNLGCCLFSSRSCILPQRLLVAEEGSDEYRAVEQVVPEREMGKPVVSSSKVAFVRKWASPGNQSALIQIYRMRCLETALFGTGRVRSPPTPARGN